MIFTMTLNPALDKYVTTRRQMKIGGVTRVYSAGYDCGGKGINVSKVIKTLDGNSTACAILGGQTGRFIADQLERDNIKLLAVMSDSDTRINTIITDPEGNRTMLNEAGPEYNAEDCSELMMRIRNHIRENDIIVLAGSLPRHSPSDLYAGYIRTFKSMRVKTVVDCSGWNIEEVLSAKPYMMKANNVNLNIEPDMREAMRVSDHIIASGVSKVVISLGANGAIYRDNKGVYLKCRAIDVPNVSVTAAGDAMVAGLVMSEEQGSDPVDAMKFATALAAAEVMTEGTKAPGYDLVERLLPKAVIENV